MSLMLWKWDKNNLQIKKIYTDWANHYLEKNRHKRLITDLQVDICDGVLLADVILAVTNERVQNIKTKPRTSTQMIENINACLTFLASKGVNVEGLNAKDIRDGNLKAILGLFFSLSRFKQLQKGQAQIHQHNINQNTVGPGPCSSPTSEKEATSPTTTTPTKRTALTNAAPNNANSEMLSRLPSAFKGGNKNPSTASSASSTSTKDTAANVANANQVTNLNRQKIGGGVPTLADRGRSNLSSPNNNNNNTLLTGRESRRNSTRSLSGGQTGLISNKNSISRESSRSTSPCSAASSIPTPGGRNLGGGRSQIAVPSSLPTPDRSNRISNSTSTSSCASLASTSSTRSSVGKPAYSSVGPNNKNSMLDKFKFFNSKEKDKNKNAASKGTSSSSKSSSKDAERTQNGSNAYDAAVASMGAGARLTQDHPQPSSGNSPKLKKGFGLKGMKKKDGSTSASKKKKVPTATLR